MFSLFWLLSLPDVQIFKNSIKEERMCTDSHISVISMKEKPEDCTWLLDNAIYNTLGTVL